MPAKTEPTNSPIFNDITLDTQSMNKKQQSIEEQDIDIGPLNKKK